MRRLLFSLSVVPKQPRFVSSNDVGDKVTVVFGLFLELSADRNAVFLLMFAHQPWYRFCCNAPHVEHIRQNSQARSIRQSDNAANIVNRSSSVCVFPLPCLKQNMMQIRCSFTSFILAGRYDRRTALTRRHKNAQKKHTHVLTAERHLGE